MGARGATETDTKRARGDETRRRLLETATRLFSERGYDGVSVKDIATAAGVSQGSLFWHFGSKQGLLFRVVDAAFAEWERQVLAPVLDRAAGPASVGVIVEAHRSFSRRNPEVAGHLFFALISDALGTRPQLRAAYARLYERFRGYGREWVRDAVAAGECRSDVDPNAVAAVIVGALAGVTVQSLIGGDTIDFDRAHQDLAVILERGLSPASGDGDRK
ncbi:MAG: TetR/AcrR family transcriptional regulator [Myxococcales bacterium]|jgi:AcrR family transcriptional regulator|nr:MAG: TetR/AcrR family transcriptional regulator [Myxococcales bacterium]